MSRRAPRELGPALDADAERDALAAARSRPPLVLLDDVMSELDRDRRQSLVDLLRSTAGQSVITATDLEHVPGSTDDDVTHLAVAGGRLLAGAR